MQEQTIEIQRARLFRYQEVRCLLTGAYVLGWLLLRLGLAKALRDWVESLTYRINSENLFISGCFSVWGVVLHRYEKTIPLAKITDVKLVQGPVLNRMNLWGIHIQTAGQGTFKAEATLWAPENPHGVRDHILHAVREAQ